MLNQDGTWLEFVVRSLEEDSSSSPHDFPSECLFGSAFFCFFYEALAWLLFVTTVDAHKRRVSRGHPFPKMLYLQSSLGYHVFSRVYLHG